MRLSTGEERREFIAMTEEQFERLVDKISDLTADKVTTKLEHRFFVSVGKAVFERGLALIGLGAVSIVFLWQNSLWPFNK